MVWKSTNRVVNQPAHLVLAVGFSRTLTGTSQKSNSPRWSSLVAGTWLLAWRQPGRGHRHCVMDDYRQPQWIHTPPIRWKLSTSCLVSIAIQAIMVVLRVWRHCTRLAEVKRTKNIWTCKRRSVCGRICQVLGGQTKTFMPQSENSHPNGAFY